MAYNTNTRLLLNFGGSSGTPPDTSEFSRSVTYTGAYSLPAGDGPFGDRCYKTGSGGGYIEAYNIFSNSGATYEIRLDFRIRFDSVPTQAVFLGGVQASYNDTTNYGNAVSIFFYPGTPNRIEVTAYTEYEDEITSDFSFTPVVGTWYHFRLRYHGSAGRVNLGVDGTEQAYIGWYTSLYPETTNAYSYAQVGASVSGVSYDCVQVLENDYSWGGGSYTVPTSPPDDYAIPGPPERLGQGANSTDYVSSASFGDVSGSGIVGGNEVDPVTSSGYGEVFWPEILGVGSNTTQSVTSKTPELHNDKTRLLVKFNDHGALGYSSALGLYYSQDTAAAGRKVYLETPSGLEHTSTQGMFGTSSMRFGNPSGTHNPGRMFVEPTTGLFSDSATAARRFDLWFRKEADAIYGLCALFSITFLNGDHVYLWRSANDIGLNIKKAGVETSITGSYPSGTNNVWRHVRVLLNDNVVTVAAGGTQRATQTLASAAWPGGPSNPIAEVIFGQFPPLANADPLYYGFRGCLDGIEWLEGDTSYVGGSYTLPTREPADFDPTYVAGIVGTGGNTTATISSSGDGKIVLLASGSNSVSDFQGSGRAEFGQWWVGVGANTLDYVQSSWTVFQVPPAIGTGSATTETSSSGDGLVQWLIRASGSNTVENVAHGGTGEVVSPSERTGQGQNTTTVSSLATGSVSVLGSGASSTEVTASAAGLVAFNAVSHVLVEVFSSGSGKAIVSAAGWNSTSVSGSGFTTVETLGRGTSEIGVAAVCNGAVLCSGSGGNALDDVRTYFPAGYFDAFLYEVVKQQRNEHWVKQ